MGQKVFKSIDEQIEILRDKGLTINDVEYAKDILLRENYFFLNGYRNVFTVYGEKKSFVQGSTFEELYGLFYFDRQFRNIIFKNILIVENNYKSMFSYVISKNYGYRERDYLNVNNFDKSKRKQTNDLLRKLKRQIRINGSQHQATSHYMFNYGYVPLWVGVKVLSFGIMSELYSILKNEDKRLVAQMYDLNPDDLSMYLVMLSNYRNLCAHEDILYNHKTQRTINDTSYHKKLNIARDEEGYVHGKSDIFALVIILKSMLREDDFKMMMNEINYEIDVLSSKLKSVNISKVLDLMGFVENYRDIMYLEKENDDERQI